MAEQRAVCAAVPVRALLQLPLLGVNRGYKGLYGGGWPLRGMGAAGTALGAADARMNEHYEIGTILTQKSQGARLGHAWHQKFYLWAPKGISSSVVTHAPSPPGRMRLTSRQSISSWCATRRVFRHRREQQAARRNSRRHRRSTSRAAVPHPSTKLPPRKTARSDALTIEMSVLEARPPTAPESWLLSGISSPPWVRSRHNLTPIITGGIRRRLRTGHRPGTDPLPVGSHRAP